MSMSELDKELLKMFALGKRYQTSIIRRLETIVKKFGVLNLKKWRNFQNRKNTLLHELVEQEMADVIQFVIINYKFDPNESRSSDGFTPLQLAMHYHDASLCDLLKDLGAKEVTTEDVSRWMLDEDKAKSMNIVWIDLEMTSIKNPEILECAVIITDKDLNVLEKGNWVIHFDQSVLDNLEDWHQETFASKDKGGNGLFDEVLKSKISRQQAEKELLTMIQRHCPEQKCPLAGSSIHIDKQVLQSQMPTVHDYLHYRIIDVTSFQSVMRRWAPWIEAKIKKDLAKGGQDAVNHRAMDDIVWSISFMKGFQSFLVKSQVGNNRKNESPSYVRRKRSASPKGSPKINYMPRNQPLPQKQVAVRYQPQPRNQQVYNGLELYGDERRLLDRLDLERKINVANLRLNGRDQKLYDENPHLHEVYLRTKKLEVFNAKFSQSMRFLTKAPNNFDDISNDPHKISTTEHWGQRKLLLTEIEFLTNHGTVSNSLVIYVGAAPGSHLNFLSKLFPYLQFILFDKTQLDVVEIENIVIGKEPFSEDVAKKLGCLKRDIFFICNVHTFDPCRNQNENIEEDMKLQEQWYKLLKPRMSLLSFRLPRTPGSTRYYDGQQIIEPWASKRTNECRLVVEKNAEKKDYDNIEFEKSLNYFHNVIRIMYYEHDIEYEKSQGLDHCYDCRVEIFILQEYLNKVQDISSINSSLEKTAQLSADISKNIVNKTREQYLGIRRTLDVIKKVSKISTDL